ncbi:hypothetical protein TIFTF001_053125 [Ficus carica]|uniref:Uncharacterized protein n=1 Tax=Ficus carica TaxID=3494 RepID=A0AA88JEQ2_FICCA|nr:hypothetical protein TIFTF001_053125 [Ficus carica]
MIKGESSVQERISLPPYKKEEYKKIALSKVPWIFKWEYIILEDSDDGLPRLGRILFGRCCEKFNYNHLTKKNINIILIQDEEEEKSETTPSQKESVSQLISSLTQEKRKLLLEEKKKLKQFLRDSSEDEDDKEDRSPLISEDSYKAIYREHFAQDPYEDYKIL